MIYPNFLRAFQAAPKVTKNPEGTKFSKYLAGYLYRASEGTSAENISKDILDCEDDAAYTN